MSINLAETTPYVTTTLSSPKLLFQFLSKPSLKRLTVNPGGRVALQDVTNQQEQMVVRTGSNLS